MSIKYRLRRSEEWRQKVREEERAPDLDPSKQARHQELWNSLSEEHQHAIEEAFEAVAESGHWGDFLANPTARRLLDVIAELEHQYEKSTFPFVLPVVVASYLVSEEFYTWSTCPNCHYPAVPAKWKTPCFTLCPVCGGKL